MRKTVACFVAGCVVGVFAFVGAAGAQAPQPVAASSLDRDAKMTALRLHWLGEFQKVVPANIAARAMQIDRRLSMLAQLEISSQIPLVR